MVAIYNGNVGRGFIMEMLMIIMEMLVGDL